MNIICKLESQSRWRRSRRPEWGDTFTEGVCACPTKIRGLHQSVGNGLDRSETPAKYSRNPKLRLFYVLQVNKIYKNHK